MHAEAHARTCTHTHARTRAHAHTRRAHKMHTYQSVHTCQQIADKDRYSCCTCFQFTSSTFKVTCTDDAYQQGTAAPLPQQHQCASGEIQNSVLYQLRVQAQKASHTLTEHTRRVHQLPNFCKICESLVRVQIFLRLVMQCD